MNRARTLPLFILAALICAVLFFRHTHSGFTYANAHGLHLSFKPITPQVVAFQWHTGQDEVSFSEMLQLPSEPPPALQRLQDGFESSELRIQVDAESLCFQAEDRGRHSPLGRFCPTTAQSFSVSAPAITHVYGLGEQFVKSHATNWIGRIRNSGFDPNEQNRGQKFGNNMQAFAGGAVGNAQFPILYALGEGLQNFALFFDNVHRQSWDLTAQPWKITSDGGPLRGLLIRGEDLPTLRKNYLDLTGHPPVPPRKAFGLWISEYGFDNWQELEDKQKSLRQHGFPVDGYVLDVQWFGGVMANSEASAMGRLAWNENAFPQPQAKIRQLQEQGLGLMLIEESYIAKGVTDPLSNENTFAKLDRLGFLPKLGTQASSLPVIIDYNPWWGRGGMLDWTNREAADYWHDQRRQPLMDIGVIGHWADLGEPEMFDPGAFYNHGQQTHAEIHNLYNFKWVESIDRGYRRHGMQRRPWILTRSGTSGIQRFSTALWSGDIGSNLESLSAQFHVQSHMALSGIDYFGSDVGGFHREALKENLNEMYTQWFAASSAIDVPVRVHTENLCNCKQTAPDRIGDVESNLFNIRQRYELLPYYYSLAHLAYEAAQPVISPLVLYAQEDVLARDISTEKWIGRDLLVTLVSQAGARDVSVYLPKGQWYNYHSAEKVESPNGRWLKDIPLRSASIFRLPLFARAGAIIPRASSPLSHEILLRVFPSTEKSEFTLFQDDGETVAYQKGMIQKTRIVQKSDAASTTVEVFTPTPNSSINSAQIAGIELADTHQRVRRVQLNGTDLPRITDSHSNSAQQVGWWMDSSGYVTARATATISEPQKWIFYFIRR